MEGLLDWLDNMPGPQFLGLYVGVIVATAVTCFLTLRYSGSRSASVDAQIPANPDPYEVAFLRGGRSAVQSLVLVDLAYKGYIRQRTAIGGLFVRQVEGAPDPFKLPEPIREIFHAIGKGEEPLRKLLLSRRVREAFDRLIKPYETRLSDRFIVPSLKRWQVYLFGLAVVIGLGGFKLADALAEGRRNVAFLIFFGLVGMMALGLATAGVRLTAAGSRYLKRIQVGYSGDRELPLAFALLGPAALVGSANAAYASMLGVNPNAARSGSSSCGSSCGGGGGGGGCGGGCGGCGGGD